MKKIPALLLPLLLFACVSEPELIPLETGRPRNPGDYFEVAPESPLVQDRFEYLLDYLEKTSPRILPLELVRAFGQVADGRNVILVCRYRQGGKETWLKAEIRGDADGKIVGRTIQAVYQIDKLEQEL